MKRKNGCVAPVSFKQKLVGRDKDLLLAAGNTDKMHRAVAESKQGVIRATANVDAGMDVRAALTNQNVASNASLTVCFLHAKTLGLGVTTVLRGANALLMSEKLQIES